MALATLETTSSPSRHSKARPAPTSSDESGEYESTETRGGSRLDDNCLSYEAIGALLAMNPEKVRAIERRALRKLASAAAAAGLR